MARGVGAQWGRILAGSAAVALLLAPGCGGRNHRPLVVAFDESIMTLDPHLQNHAATWSVLINVYDGLVRFSPEMRLEPSLATSWEKLDATRWRLRLRRGVRFSDGSTFDAADVVASLERARTHPRSEVRHLIVGVRGVREEGADAVVMETADPLPDLLNRLAFLAIVPSEAASRAEITEPVGTGPYRFEKRLANGDILLAGWASWRGRPAIREVRLCFLADAGEAVRRLINGAADVVRRPPDDMLREIERHRHLRLVPQPRLGVQLLAVIPNAPAGAAGGALADPRVRRALILALDREGWVSRVFRGNGTVASQYVHPVVFGYDPAIQPAPFDPDQARRLLAEAGYAEGFAVKLVHVAGRTSLVDAVEEDLAKVKIRVLAEGGSYAEALARVRTGQADLFLYGWICSTGDASDFLNSSIHSRDIARGLGLENYGGFADPVTDRLLEEADRELVPERRLQLLQEAQRRTLQSLPVLPLTVRWGFVATSDRVEVRTRHDERIWLFDYRWRT